MRPGQWERVKSIVAESWDREGSDRVAFLDEACGGDAVVRGRGEALLAAERRMGEVPVMPQIGLSGTDWEDSEEEEALPPGTRVGRFSIEDVIGKGGMGVV